MKISSITWNLTIFTQILSAQAFQLLPFRSHPHHLSNKAIFATSEEPTQSNLIASINDYEDRIPTDISNHRSGFVSIIGKPNMGKSTLLNSLLDQTLCITTPRPQTTRHSILGIFSDDRNQLCFLDTPGVISKPGYKLQEEMNESIKGAFRDGDLILFVTQMEVQDKESTTEENEGEDSDMEAFQKIFSILQKTDKPIIVLINKCDLLQKLPDPEQDIALDKTIQKWRSLLPDAKCILPLSAAQNKDHPGFAVLKAILLAQPDLTSHFRNLGKPRKGMFPSLQQMWLEPDDVWDYIPEGPPLYDANSISDRSERFFCSEIIRKTIFQLFGKEVPYCCEILIVNFKEPTPENPITRIRADIVVERDSQKGILIGKQGKMIKQIGMRSRTQLQDFLQEDKVFLELSVRVDKNWRRNEDRLIEFGYSKKKKKVSKKSKR